MWIDVKGYENLYVVNELGEIKSIKRSGTCGRILKQSKDTYGYKTVSLSKNCKIKNVKVHRIVFFSFNPNVNESLQINHKNENIIDNNLNNLEAVTQLVNLNYGTRNERIGKSLINRKDCSKK